MHEIDALRRDQVADLACVVAQRHRIGGLAGERNLGYAQSCSSATSGPLAHGDDAARPSAAAVRDLDRAARHRLLVE
ncbi:MAG: hypothetical protein M5U07_19335 [Xanthobacteraceae bacterium]|nr:hypothetical protein [Xanthobacteraceae bacterium]